MSAPRIGLDWDSPKHWGGGRRLPCAHCHRPAFCRDEHDRPCHKTCAEAALTARPTARDDLDLGRSAA